jgi:hypothetical protein
MWFLPPSVLGYAWVAQKHVHVAAVAVFLFFCGFFSMSVSNITSQIYKILMNLFSPSWIYTSTLAYIVDANTGRSSVAVAINSGFRGTAAFVATEIAVPLQVGLSPNVSYLSVP